MKNKILQETEEKMKKVLNFFSREVNSLRAGRASVSFLEGILVDYYGSKLPINQLATVTIPQPQLIVVQCWDKTITDKIAKAIQASNLGLNPQVEAGVIRISVPPLSEERRRELVKVLHRMTEEAKVELRELRRKANEELKAGEKEKKISEDDFYRGTEEVKKVMDKVIEELEKKSKEKEKEIMEE